MLTPLLADSWFWAFLAAVGWAGGFGIVGTNTLGRCVGYGIAMFIFAEHPHILLPLPFVYQPRIVLNPTLLFVIGILVLTGSLFFGTSVFRIVPLTKPDQHEPLRTDGQYSIIRHPFMVCDIFWPLGWSLIFGSVMASY